MAAVVEYRDGEIERLKLIIKKLQRAQFGRRSERLDDDQLVLALDDLESDIGQIEESHPITIAETAGALPKRKPLPDHLPREEILLDVPSDACPCCGGTMHRIGESESEMLDWVPARLRVIRATRPKYACRVCNKVVQAAAPERPIAGGLATPALLAQVLVSKYCDHTPLYRQSQIFARHGVEIERSTLAGWVGGACSLIQTAKLNDVESYAYLHDVPTRTVNGHPKPAFEAAHLQCRAFIKWRGEGQAAGIIGEIMAVQSRARRV